MKKFILFILAVVVIGIIFRVVNKSNRVVVESPTPSSIQTYTLAVLDNTVSVKSTNSSEFRVVSGQLEIQQGDEIKTDSRGRANLLYPNGTITTIEADTHLKVESLDRDGDRSRLTLLVGSLWSKVKNILGTGDYYEIETENTVASVRGTIFNTEFRNRITRIQGIESTVRVEARDPVKKTLIEGTGVDITSGEKVSVSSDQIPPPRKALVKQALSDDDFRRPAVKRQIVEQLEREDTEGIEKDREREFIKRVKEKNLDDREFIEKLKQKRLIEDDEALPTKTATPTPTQKATPTPTVLSKPTPTPTPALISSPSTLASPTPTKPTVKSVSPKTTKPGTTIAVNGDGFMANRNVPQISGALLGQKQIQFAVVDGLTVFVDIPGDTPPGTYDIGLTTVGGDMLVLPQALIVQ